MARRRVQFLPTLLAGAACVALIRAGSQTISRAFAGLPASSPREQGARSLRHASPLGDLNMQKMEEMMKDPEKLKQLQAEVDKVMQDPEKRKVVEQWQDTMKGAVDKLKDDPEMKEFFEDIEKNGYEAMKKYENNDRILAKFSQATGGPPGMGGPAMPGMPGMPGMGMPGMAPPQARTFKAGDEVIINGLQKAPQLNGKKAMVVPPTAEERAKLEGTDRLIVRLLDSGDQFAVKPSNLRTTAEAADAAMSKNLEDVSLYDPALQTEAAKLRDSGKLDDLQNDPELKPIFEDIKKNGMAALEKYWDDDKLMAKISKAMGTA